MFKIEDGFNTSYIDSLLIALLYRPTNIYKKILIEKPNDNKLVELQKTIQQEFIEYIRTNKSISCDILNKIRIISHNNGWKRSNPASLLELHNILDYFCFYNDKLLYNYIQFEQTTLSYISVDIDQLDTNNNLLSNLIKKDQKIKNIPNIIPIYINRFGNILKNSLEIDITKKIKFKDVTNSYLYWSIFAIVCHEGQVLKSGHYYTIIRNDTDEWSWTMFDNTMSPSTKTIDILDPDNASVIKKNCVFVMYKYNEYIS